MSLLDHFNEPIFPKYPWESLLSLWAVSIGGELNRLLPARFFAAIHIHRGNRVEHDISDFEERSAQNSASLVPLVFPDDFEVQVFDTRDGHTLAGAIELVSPGNLDRLETRRAFAAKCAAYLQRGIGLIVIDIVTCHHFNLHNELIDLLQLPALLCMPSEAVLYAVSYRPVHRHDVNQADFWPVPLAVTQDLPSLPFALKGGPIISVNLESTYAEARQRSRL